MWMSWREKKRLKACQNGAVTTAAIFHKIDPKKFGVKWRFLPYGNAPRPRNTPPARPLTPTTPVAVNFEKKRWREGRVIITDHPPPPWSTPTGPRHDDDQNSTISNSFFIFLRTPRWRMVSTRWWCEGVDVVRRRGENGGGDGSATVSAIVAKKWIENIRGR